MIYVYIFGWIVYLILDVILYQVSDPDEVRAALSVGAPCEPEFFKRFWVVTGIRYTFRGFALCLFIIDLISRMEWIG